jgi:hypothetical protein
VASSITLVVPLKPVGGVKAVDGGAESEADASPTDSAVDSSSCPDWLGVLDD